MKKISILFILIFIYIFGIFLFKENMNHKVANYLMNEMGYSQSEFLSIKTKISKAPVKGVDSNNIYKHKVRLSY
ncbi:hypothetical protein [Paenibacillus sp. CMAA1364]